MGVSTPNWEHAEELTAEWVNNGWTIEHVSPNTNGEIILIMSKNEEKQEPTMLLD